MDHMHDMHDHAGHHPAAHPTEPPAGHGMAVIGEQPVYLSHLPMFMFPHDQQVLLRVSLEGDGDPQQVYFDDRKQHPEQRLYTFNPVPFVLSTLFAADEAPAEATSFQGTLHRGHFERASSRPVQIAADVTARVSNVIHHHRFQPDTAALEALQYLLFGKGSEIFLAHFINAPPDFDQLLSVDIDVQLSDEDLSIGSVVKFDGRPNTVATRIKPGVDSDLSAVAEIDGRSLPLKVRPKVEFYFEARELAEAM